MYLITVPVTYAIFTYMFFAMWTFWDTRWYDLETYEHAEESALSASVNGAFEFLSDSTIALKVNFALSASTLMINQFAELKREAMGRSDPAFFRWISKSQLVQRGELRVEPARQKRPRAESHEHAFKED